MEQPTAEVVIIGAGIPGLALASLLQDQSIRTLLIDARRNVDGTPRGLALQPNGLEALDQLGVMDRVAGMGLPTRVFEIRDWEGELLLEADYRLLDHPYNYLLTVNASDLEIALRDEAETKGARILWGTKYRYLVRDSAEMVTGVTIDSSDGESMITCRLVVGADGAQSKVRTATGSKVKTHKYEDSFVVGLLGPASGLGDHARQYQAPGRMLGVMPLGKDATYIHYCVGSRSLDEIKQGGLSRFSQEVTSVAPELARAFSGVEAWSRFGYFTPSYIRVDRWVSNGTALLGDSAHTFHPHAGQGLNLSLQDALALSRVAAQCHQTGNYSVSSLQAYQEERKPFADVIGEHAHYAAVYALSKNRVVRRLNKRAMKRLRKNQELLKTTLEITAGVFKKKPGLIRLARIGGILP